MSRSSVLSLASACTVVALSAAAGVATAGDFRATPSLASDYAFRGVSRSALDPSAALRLSYADEATALTGSVTATTVDFGRNGPDVELLPELGLSLGTVDAVAFDTGVRYYAYDGDSALNHPELWFGASAGALALRFDWSWDFFGTGEDAWHVAGRWEQPLQQGFRLQAQVGYSGGGYWDRFYGDGYFDVSVGVAKRFGHFDVALAYVDADLRDGPSDVFSSGGRVWLQVSSARPWSAD